MATRKRRTRLLSFDGRQFRWRCEFNHPSEVHSVGYAERGEQWPPDVLVVRPEVGPHQRLDVTWPPCTGPVVTPGLVRACVAEALRRGWLTESAVLELNGADVPLGEA
jgi:hypothetical protein